MLSDESKTILNNAISTVLIRCKNVVGVNQIVDEVRKQADIVASRPDTVRERFFEPSEISQKLGVPMASVEAVAGEFYRMGILHVWARVKCPNVEVAGENILVETDSAETLRAQLDVSCRYCGQLHQELSWADIDMVFALNLDADKAKELDLSSFFGNARPQPDELSAGRGQAGGQPHNNPAGDGAPPQNPIIRAIEAAGTDVRMASFPREVILFILENNQGLGPALLPEQQHVVISLHGIRTRGEWQKRFAPDLAASGYIPEPLDYGFFRAIKLLIPSYRRAQVDWFRDQYTLIRQRFPDARISIVAHSMGTYIVGRAMEIYKEIVFDKVIFCGAIVRRDYSWSVIMGRSQFSRALNDYGNLDIWARIVAWVVCDAGQSGLRGFEDLAEGNVVQRQYLEFRHSDYFYTLNYQHNWIPFLKGKDPDPAASFPVLPRNWRFMITVLIVAVAVVVVAICTAAIWSHL